MASFWGDVCAHSGLFLIFLVTFYFTFVVYVQSNALADDTFRLLKDGLTSVVLATDADTRSAIVQALQQFEGTADPTRWLPDWVLPTNATVKQVAMATCYGLGSVLLVLGLGLEWTHGGSVWDMLLGNMIVLAFLAGSEFAIVGLFVASFVEVNKDTITAILYKQGTQQIGNTLNCRFVEQFAYARFPKWMADILYANR
jgi:hypothetical protein